MALDKRHYPAPGQRVDVGGYQLHIHCLGEGNPTVILEAALPGASAHWGWVQPDIATTTPPVLMTARACAGATLVRSPVTPKRLPLNCIRCSIMPGLKARSYYWAIRSVAYMPACIRLSIPTRWSAWCWSILHIPTSGRASHRKWWQVPFQTSGCWRSLPFLARLGLTRLLGFFPADPELPAQHRSEIKAFSSSTKYMAANSAELLAIAAASAQVLNAGSLGDRPLVVLTALDSFDGLPAGLATRAQQAWEELQADLAGLSSNGIHRLIEGTTRS
jgi:hypothetical protein